MTPIQFTIRQLLNGIPLLVGVTFLSFLLMVYFGPDLTYQLLGKNPSTEDIARVYEFLGYDQSFISRYFSYLYQILTLEFGLSMVTDQPVNFLLKSTIPVSLLLTIPGFVLGNVLSVVLALMATRYQSRIPDKIIMSFSVIGMSLSFLVIIIVFQTVFSSSYGLGWFPVRGWYVNDPDGSFSLLLYFKYVAVPTLAIIFVTLGYNTRFYRAVFVEEANKNHIQTALAFGYRIHYILFRIVLKNAMVPIMTRLIFSIPLIIISGSLLIESFFGIPGIGYVTYEAIMAGDQPVLKAIIGLTALLFVLALILSDILNQFFDPRVTLS